VSDDPLADLVPLQPVTRGDVARGAGLAGLARSGAIIEAVTQPLYVWMFGLSTYGLYVVLWGAVNLSTNVLDFSLPNALQRLVPTRTSEALAHGAVKFAMLVTLALTTLVAALVSLNAEAVASLVHADAVDSARVPAAIAFFVWALPIWTFVEVSTSAARARRAFGPEIRLRIFWEQIARLVFAVGFFALGERTTGLMAAHLCSLAVMALLCVPLLRRFYDLRLMVRAPIPLALVRESLATGLALLPSNVSRRMLIDAPPLMINLIIAGPGAAAAAGLFEIARKLSTVTYIVRQSFQYVLAPLSSAQASADRSSIGPLYHFSTRVSTALVVPLAGLIVFSGRDLLSVYRPEAMAALSLLPILCAARAAEAIVGPAGTIVEMIGHRGLPLLNSAIALLLWAALATWLTPQLGAMGMAIAVSVAIVAASCAAVVELQVSDGLSPFDYKLWQGLGLALGGVAAMALPSLVLGGPARFAATVALWAATSWLTLRYGLTREDRLALGGLSRKLRLV
jgi:O-antigen/teichoic acid export membrane protein